MIKCLLIVLCLSFTTTIHAQFYYRDIISTQQTMEQLKRYRSAGIRSVKVISYETTGEKVEDFEGSQTITDNYSTIRTNLKTPLAGPSQLVTHFNAAGRLVKTSDTTEGSGSISDYHYNIKGQVVRIVNVSTSAGGHRLKEEHRWLYNADGKPEKMLRIRNDADTITVTFVLDEKGNVAEENTAGGRSQQSSYYYYYSDKNQLTDIVRYNERARRLLPLYIFEYDNRGAVSSMMVVPEGSDDYQRWVYEYNASGLKTKETCFNKRRQMLGRIEYEYR